VLGFPKKRFRLVGRAQSGFYVDFFFKKIAEVFIRNIFIYAALFFGEKYMVEQITKKTVDSFVFGSNRFFGWGFLSGSSFFFTTLTLVFYLIFFINVCYLF